MNFTNFKISRESIFLIHNMAHVRSRKTFYHISVNFRCPGFRSVSKPRKPVFTFRTGPTTIICVTFLLSGSSTISCCALRGTRRPHSGGSSLGIRSDWSPHARTCQSGGRCKRPSQTATVLSEGGCFGGSTDKGRMLWVYFMQNFRLIGCLVPQR